MNNDEYMQKMIDELAADGIVAPNSPVQCENKNQNDKELEIILNMEKVTGTQFSDEQRKILEHHGNACILACAGSGKTTTSVNLIAKRILSGEIADVNKLIYATYSKAGATEMQDRLNKLLNTLGVHVKVEVRTLHSFFLKILRTFGNNANIIEESTRRKFIKESCKEAEFTTKDDELALIDNLLSYQVNNLLSDKKTIESSVNTIESLTVEQYAKIRKGYADKKAAKGLIDYDDMQTYLYVWMVKYMKSSKQAERDMAVGVLQYCKAMWTDFYIDEAQDVSKIQFAILRAMVTELDNKNKLDKGLVFIGDDDQCLLEDTLIATDSGLKIIKDIQTGDKVLSVDNGKIVKSTVINTYSHGINNSIPLVQITTASGRSYIATADHKVMVKIPEKFMEETISYGGNKYVISDVVKEFLDAEEPDKRDTLISRITERLTVFGYLIDLPHFGRVKTNNGYVITSAMSLRSGMIFGRLSDNNEDTVDDEIISVEVINKSEMIKQEKRVYCLNLASNHNYFANGLLTHNCIYQWRGSDPSIILSIGATFDMKVFVLSTNYRCYSEVVNYAAHGIRCNNSRYTKGMKAFNEGGNVKILQSNKTDLCSLSILAMKQIKKWIDNGDNPSDIAVLCRNNFHLAILSNMLLREGIYCNYTNDMKLTKSYMYSDIKNIINICDTTWKPELTKSIMWKLCRYMSLANAAFIAEVQDTLALSLEDTLGWLTKNFIDKNIEFNKPIKVSVQLDEKAKYTMSKMSSETLNDIKLVYTTLKIEDKVEKLETLMYKYMESAAYLYKSRDKSRSIQGLVIYIKNLIKKDGYDNMLEFLRVTEQLEDGRMVIPGEKLTLTTIHSAKGREWKNVIMFACDNVSMPNYDTIKKMSEDELPVSDIYNYIDEERRLYYVGNTRAKSNLVSITYNEPSIFMMECIGIFDNKLGSNNNTVLSLALDPTEMVKYKDDVDKKLKDTNSKYYYTLD